MTCQSRLDSKTKRTLLLSISVSPETPLPGFRQSFLVTVVRSGDSSLEGREEFSSLGQGYCGRDRMWSRPTYVNKLWGHSGTRKKRDPT